ncbi:MAG: UDP-N-acetylmuramoyl-L-alanine--D-glutamate ligase [Candidatus Kaiserbacteria bacterium]|nr:UDP-N-acetylmuramoyl-L-alanine--D-glutamate ligase [Candidatus Kaiserbacteria bacterium]MCB9816323.1 UDP-N-acetylmuramoyl-L-alanine--D-glutamate ligase [Candidatus Nomurabacteria bacterium]
MNYAEYFNGKRVTVMRIGLLGRGVGDAAFLAEMGADVHVVDDAPAEVMQPSVDALKDYPNIRFTFGSYQEEHFTQADYVLVGAGAPLNMPELEAARAAGVELKQSAAWFAELSQVPVIGVTGTRGKSTVTHMIHHVLSEVTGEKILLGGNVRGLSNLQLLKAVQEDSLCVMELDSWQLQGFGWAKISPQIAVFTNFMEDHLNYYMAGGRSKEEAMRLYFADKANIFKYQEETGVLVTTPEVFEWAKQLGSVSVGQEIVLADVSSIPEDSLLSMPGEHNRLNAALAYEALKAVSLGDEEIFAGLASFPGVEGRLQYLGERDGVKIYNDNNATTPQATIRGLQAVGNEDDKNVILIAGGAYKNLDPSPLLEMIPQYCKKVVLLPGTGTDCIKEEIEAEVVGSVESAVKAGLACGEPGDVLLFSPGFASFGLFKNEYERNDAFIEAVDKL